MGEVERLREMLSFYANGGVAAPSSSPALASLPHFCLLPSVMDAVDKQALKRLMTARRNGCSHIS